MATWDDVKAAADKAAGADAGVLAYLVELKGKLADLTAKIAALPAGPSSADMQAVVDELNKGADDVAAAITPAPADPVPPTEPVVPAS